MSDTVQLVKNALFSWFLLYDKFEVTVEGILEFFGRKLNARCKYSISWRTRSIHLKSPQVDANFSQPAY
jgi:hypothetical protein